MMYGLFGATGSLGKALAAELFSKEKSFRVVGRSVDKLKGEFSKYEPLVEYHAADLSDPKAAAGVARGIDTVVYLVGQKYTEFQLHPKFSRVCVDAAASEGVKHFIHVGTIYPYGRPKRNPVDETHPREPHTFKGRMRKEQEDIVLGADGKNGMRTLVVRPPDFYGPNAELSYVASIFEAAKSGGRANVIGPVDKPHEFIFIPDLAKTVMLIADKEEAYGSAWNVGGPGLISTRHFAETAFAATGKEPKLLSANWLMLRVMGLFNPMMREIAEMYYLWTEPIKLDDSKLQKLLGEVPKTPYEEGIALTIGKPQPASPSMTPHSDQR